MTQKKKIFIVVLSAILGIALVLGIWCLIAPREFLQTFLPDKAYGAVTLSKNANRVIDEFAKLSKENTALHYEGEFDASASKDFFFGSETVAEKLSDYASSLKVTGDIYFKEDVVKSTFDLTDDTATAFSGEFDVNENRQCFKVTQLGDDWYELSKEKGVKKVDVQADKEVTKESLGETEIYITKEKEISIGSTSAKGEALTFQMDRDSFKNLLDSLDIKVDGSGAEYLKLSKRLSSFLESENIDDITLNLFVNKRNHIVGVSIDLSGNNEFSISFIKDENKEGSYALEFVYGELLANVEAVLSETTFEDFDMPSASATKATDLTSLKTNIASYIFGDFIKSRKDLNEVYNDIITAIVGENVGGFLNSLFGGTNFAEGLTSGITGIVDSALNEDPTKVSDIVDDFLSAFGLSKSTGGKE